MSIGRTRYWRFAGIALVGCLALGLLGAASALAEEAKFSYTGAEQEFKVPAGVTSVNVVAVGAKGLNFSSTLDGLGARVQGSIAVTPGHTLYVEVGGEGKKEVAAFNGGGKGAGGGGGASDVREVSIGAEASPGGETSLKSRLIVAGGGGGEGAAPEGCTGGPGGFAEQGGSNGATCLGAPGGEGGGAGSQTEGGNGGKEFGLPGALGTGGEGGFGGLFGGGGGGGLYGGGGGGTDEFGEGGGGGGGSNLVPSGGELELATEGEASSVTLTYTPAACSAVQGVGHIAPRGSEGQNLSVNLNTGLSGIERFTTKTPSGTARFILTHLTSASCEAIPGGYEFTGQGTARQFKEGGYEMAFSFEANAGKTYLDLTVTDANATTVYQVTHEPLTKGSKIKIS